MSKFVVVCSLVVLALATARLPGAVRFQRADSNVDGQVNLSDALTTLGFLFLGQPAQLLCEDAADSDDNGIVQLTDAVHVLGYLFLGTAPPRPPFQVCGADPTDDSVSCSSFAKCTQGPPSPPVLDALPPVTRLASIEVGGTAGPADLIRIMGGLEAKVARSGADGKFAVDVPLFRNRLNRIFVTAEDASGAASPPSAVSITQDGNPPFVSIDEPADGTEVSAAEVTVTGRVADALSGFQGLAVTVNGAAANVAIGIGTNGTFERPGVKLAVGENVIEVTASDGAGNAVSPPVTARVTRVLPPVDADRLELVSGNDQSGPIHAELPAPLLVRAVKPDGSPRAGALVTFRVTRSDGLVAESRGALPGEALRTFLVHTDAGGLASAFWRLGTDAGCGNNRLAVSGEGLFGTVVFCASATPGPATQINVGSGNHQRVETGAPAPERLRARVSDGCNGVAGVPVRFRVTQGIGSVNGLAEVTVATGETGHAEVELVAGPEAGNQEVEAGFDPPPEVSPANPALFTVLALERVGGRSTSLAGLIFDNSGQPLEGALCTLEIPSFDGVTVPSGRDGQFRFDDLPGTGPASLNVDGYFITHSGGTPGAEVPQGSYPSLSHEVVLVPNAGNSLPGPVLLPALDPANRVEFDGTREIELRIQGVDGLRMRVKADTVVKLRDGTQASPGNPVVLSLNQVHHDDVPMPMPDGAAPPFAWTLQPRGATFDPPLSIEYPNLSGLPPGAVAYFLSYDHDTQKFEIVASGRVAEDGSIIQSDPGQGIAVAGWGCNCPPYSVAGTCDDCEEMELTDVIGNGLAFAKDLAFALTDIGDGLECIASIGSAAVDCGETYKQVKADGNLTAEEITGVLGCANAVKSAVSTCLELVPDVAGMADTAKKVSDVIGAAINTAQESKCLPRWGQIALKSAETVNNIASKVLELAGKLDVKQAALVGVCAAMQAYIDGVELGAGSGGGGGVDIEELDALYADFEAKLLAVSQDEQAIQADRESLAAVLPDFDADLKTVLTDLEQSDLAGFVLKAGGQSADAGSNGGYRLANVAAPDLFGPEGPGSRPDFRSDDPVRVTGSGVRDGKTYYAFSDPFQIRRGETYIIPALTITEQPPPLLKSIAFTGGPSRLELDETGQLAVTGILGDDSVRDLTARVDWTIYRSSNSAVVSVGPDGLVTGRGRGAVFITASNDGATAVKRIDVDLDMVRVTITGIARLPDGSLATGARVESIRGAAATAGAGGAFVLGVDVLPRSTFQIRFSIEFQGVRYAQTVRVTASEIRINLGAVTLLPAARELFPGRSYLVEDGPSSVAAEDLDGDGSLDLAVANTQGGSVAVLLNQGGGLLAPFVRYAAGNQPRAVVAADLDNDLDADLALANYGAGIVSVLRNQGDGTFTAPVTYRVGTSPQALVALDITGDGALDLAVANFAASTVSLLRSLGDGTFANQVTFAVGSLPTSIAGGDIDGDIDADLVTANSAASSVSVLRNDGSGAFAAHVTSPAGNSPFAVKTADLDGDLDLDLAVANDGAAGTASVLLNQGGGTFAAPVPYMVGARPQALAASDLDGDDDLDLALASFVTNNASVLLNQGNGVFAAQVSYGAGWQPQAILTADLDGDGPQDLVVASSGSKSATVLRNQGGGVFAAHVPHAVGRNPYAVAGADLDGDLDGDLAVFNSIDATASMLRNDGSGAFAAQVAYPLGSSPSTLISASLDADGDVDLAAVVSGGIAVLLNRGDGTFPAAVTYPGSSGFAMAAADVEGDADLDIAVPFYGGSTVSVLRNQGNGALAAQETYPVGFGPSGIAAADLDGVAGVDLAVANDQSRSVSVLLNEGDGTFAAHVMYDVGQQPRAVTAADLDGDGDVDLAAANQSSNNLSVLLNQGAGTFAAQVTFAAGTFPRGLLAADLDVDGDFDLASSSFGNNTVAVLLNPGNAAFEAQRLYVVGSPSRSLAALDLNGDGAPELVIASELVNSVSVLENLSRR